MNFEQNSVLPRRFVTAVLPWIIGAVALVIYLVTMGKSATFGSAGLVASVAGWDWHSNLQRPLLMVLISPFRLLPEASVALALNVFNAVLAALVLALLARVIALLPQNRTAAQRDIEDDEHGLFSGRTAWMPPVLATIALGLQISFWESATSMTGDMVDAFVITYVVRCLLEFRIDKKQSWLTRAAFLYAAGMTNNWAFLGLAPLFLVAVIWIKGIGFFNVRFLLRMAICSIAGLLLYLVLPFISSHSSIAHVDFWPALKTNIETQFKVLSGVYRFYRDNYRIMPIAATSLLPIFVISLRWSSSFGDNSPLGIFIAKAVFHFVHALFLAICLLVVLSPPWSPRLILPGTPFLTHAVLGAIVIGYCAGYFLLICSPAFRPRTRMNPLLKFVSYLGWGAVVLMLVVMPLALVGRNYQPIWLTNTRLVEDFARHLERGLPSSRAAILCDNPIQLTVLRTHMLKQGRGQDDIFYDTTSATLTDYHVFEHRRHPDRWPAVFTGHSTNSQISPFGMLVFLSTIATNTPVYYLQPSFGYYFERFQMIPKGVVYPISSYPDNQLFASPLTEDTVKANQEFWSDFDATTFIDLKDNVPSEITPRMPAWQSKLYERLHLSRERVLIAETLAAIYSRSANYWGVELQKLGKWEEAGASFDRALALNPDNISAQVNLAYNKVRREGGTTPTDLSTTIEDRFGKYGTWNEVIASCGPFDEPRFTFEQCRTFFANRLFRQALQQIKRVTELDPRNFTAHVWMADLFTTLGHPAEAMTVVQHVRRDEGGFGVNPTNAVELARVEIAALFRSGDSDAARRKLLPLARIDASPRAHLVASQFYLQYGLFKEAIPLLERAATENPSDILAIVNLGYAYLQVEQNEAALKQFDAALELDPKALAARLNRALVLIRLKQWDKAQEDLEILVHDSPNGYQILFGLGEVSAGRNDIPKAIEYFERARQSAPPGSRDFNQVTNRLQELKTQRAK